MSNKKQKPLSKDYKVDAVYVPRGRWEKHPDVFLVERCSVCHDCNICSGWPGGKKWNYCPHCGAKMNVPKE